MLRLANTLQLSTEIAHPRLDQNLTEYSSCFVSLMYLNGGKSVIDGLNSASGINIDNDDNNNGGGGVYTEDMCFEEISFYETVVRDSQYWLKVVMLIMLGSLGLVGNIITILVLWRIDSNR